MKRLLILMTLTIVGCAVKTTDPKPMQVMHPSRPNPVNMTPVVWRALVPQTKEDLTATNDYSYMCLDWSGYLTMGQNMQSMLRYIKDENALLCYYRKDLNEIQCTPASP